MQRGSERRRKEQEESEERERNAEQARAEAKRKADAEARRLALLKNPWEYSPIGQRLVDHIYDQKSPDGRLSALTALVRDLKRQAQRDVRLIVDTHAPSWQREQPLRKRAPPQKSTEEQLDEKVRRVGSRLAHCEQQR